MAGETIPSTTAAAQPARAEPGATAQTHHIAELERELAATRSELAIALQAAANSAREQKAINEKLTALNSQLRETLDRQRQTSDDLQNVLFSTNVGTLLLDLDLRIRFFTPAIRALFNVIPGDIGRPLADLRALAIDHDLLSDAREVASKAVPIEREVAAAGGVWFLRRILPYRTHDGKVEGVVITFADNTEHNTADAAIEAAKHEAERANLAKSRFLAAASHDLRQPLQSLILLKELLRQAVTGERANALLDRFGTTLRAMAGMLNALLDINQIEAGVVEPELQVFAINEVFDRLRDDFTYMAKARNLSLRILPCRAMVESDPGLLEQMIRNLLGNAVKYTTSGKVLMGCRRRGGNLRIEVWDSGIGIPADQLQVIFEEFHQVDNAARESARGLGLGLSIVQRLGNLLGHVVDVRSVPGRGSVFAITLPAPHSSATPSLPVPRETSGMAQAKGHNCQILVVEDDPDVLDLLRQLLIAKGFTIMSAVDAASAMRLIASGAMLPDILLTDYNLPNGANGLELLASLQVRLQSMLPAIILTGDISTDTMARIAAQGCLYLSKPVKAAELLEAIARLCQSRLALPPPSRPVEPVAALLPEPAAGVVVHVVDDDAEVRDSLCEILAGAGRVTCGYGSAEAFLAAYQPGQEGCLLVDVHLPGLSGIGLLEALRTRGDQLPVILITGDGDVGLAVAGMRQGACDFIEKPVAPAPLLESIARAIGQSHDLRVAGAAQEAAAAHIADLTSRQRQVMEMVLAGHPSKNIAADLGISQRTVENHRAAVMQRMGAKSLPELARLAVVAGKG